MLFSDDRCCRPAVDALSSRLPPNGTPVPGSSFICCRLGLISKLWGSIRTIKSLYTPEQRQISEKGQKVQLPKASHLCALSPHQNQSLPQQSCLLKPNPTSQNEKDFHTALVAAALHLTQPRVTSPISTHTHTLWIEVKALSRRQVLPASNITLRGRSLTAAVDDGMV